MPNIIHELITKTAARTPENTALFHKKLQINYQELSEQLKTIASGLLKCNILPGERIAIYLPKRLETVISFFSSSLAGAVFVPINPLLKPDQVSYILKDCNVRILISSADRINQLSEQLVQCHDLHTIIDVDNKATNSAETHYAIIQWQQLTLGTNDFPARIDTDVAAILYTSGSTGKPKGVVLSHKNMIAGAKSVAQYLENTEKDNLLAVLPFSFDYGLSQLTTGFLVGATITLMDYLLPRDVIKAIGKYNITGLAGVPPLWNQLAQLDWDISSKNKLRYITNSGGAMPTATLNNLQKSLPNTDVYLMYGLTEAFRSTYLPPKELDNRPGSMGKAIPNAEIMVVREDGSPCAAGEPGELVHRGSLVSLGYWNDPQKTSEHFKPVPIKENGLTLTEIAVWSGDNVKMDEDGYLYFLSRKDEMIKTSGYRVSPSELEEIVYQTGLISEAAAFGVPHDMLGQAIIIIATTESDSNEAQLLTECKKRLPNYMHPAHIQFIQSMPKNPNGKIDRKKLTQQYLDFFQEK